MGIEQDFRVKNGLVVGQTITTDGILVSGNATFNSTGAVKLPAGTEAQRPTGAAGQLRFNSETGQFEGYDGTDWGSIGGSVEWIGVANTYTASSGDAIMATTTAGSFTVTLPGSPLTGAIVVIADGDDFFTNPLTVNGNGNLIEGYDTFTLNVQNVKVEFIYSGTSWQAFPTITTLATGSAGSSSNTNLTLTANSSTVSINSSTGTDVIIPAANTTTAGIITSNQQTFYGTKSFQTVNVSNVYGSLSIVPLDEYYGISTPGNAISFYDATGANGRAAIAIQGDALTFLNRDAPTGESMRITTNGNVGIGTTTPTSKLQVVGTPGSSQARLGTLAGYLEINAFDANPVYCVVGGNNHTAAVFGTQSNTPTIFFTNNTERMRLDTSGNLQFNSGYGSVATAYGCRAWVNFDGITGPTIRGSGNVSSVTRTSTGNYTINFTTAMPDANYVVQVTPKSDAGGYNQGQVLSTSEGSCAVVNSPDRTDSIFNTSIMCVSVFR